MKGNATVAFDKATFTRIMIAAGFVGAGIGFSTIHLVLEERFNFIKPMPALLYAIACFVLIKTYVKGSASFICCICTSITFIIYMIGDIIMLTDSEFHLIAGAGVFGIGHLVFSFPSLFKIVNMHKYCPKYKIWHAIIVGLAVMTLVSIRGFYKCSFNPQVLLSIPYASLLAIPGWRVFQFDTLKLRYRVISTIAYITFLISDSIIVMRGACGFGERNPLILVTYYSAIGMLAVTCIVNSFHQASKVTKQALQFLVKPQKTD